MIDDKQTCDVCIEETKEKHTHKKLKKIEKKRVKSKNRQSGAS